MLSGVFKVSNKYTGVLSKKLFGCLFHWPGTNAPSVVGNGQT